MTYSQTQSKKYQMTDKLPIGINWHGLKVFHPKLSAQDLAALAATLSVKAFQKNMNNKHVAAMFARAVFDGNGLPNSYPMPENVEFAVDFSYAGTRVSIGDKGILIPRIRLVAYRPVQLASGRKYFPLPSEESEQCRGVLELTLDQGIVLITEHRGWIGSNEIVEYLRKQFEAAVA